MQPCRTVLEVYLDGLVGTGAGISGTSPGTFWSVLAVLAVSRR